MGLSKNGNPCMLLSAFVAAVTSANTTQAWPRSRYVFMQMMSRILPNWEKMACKHFFSSAIGSQNQYQPNAGLRIAS